MVLVISLFFAFMLSFILTYVFSSIAFYRFMKNRNLDNAFLAWIPIVNVYTIGKVCDDINESKSKNTHFSVIMLVIECVYIASFLSSTIINIELSFAMLILELICYNCIFKEYAPNNSNYFILTIIFSIIQIVPFIPSLCLLKASKNQPCTSSKRIVGDID